MKHIGIVGITAEGASLCYKTIISESAKILGSNIHPEISLNNQPFDQILALQKKKNWGEVAELVCKSIGKLASIGADFAIIPANSIHYAISQIQNSSKIPILNLVDIVAVECKTKGYKKTAILGVGITMSDSLYEKPLKDLGIELVTPPAEAQSKLNELIYNEIVPARHTAQTTTAVIAIINDIKSKGCDSVILGCTELPIIINENNSPLPFIDTTRLLAIKALDYSLL